MDAPKFDHLFRHQYGKMVAILTRIFGLSNLQLIEDAVQDTFVLALKKWAHQYPENPEAWLTKAAKNRVVDLFRKAKANKNQENIFAHGPAAIHINELFLDHEIEDSQLRMIFTACHPALKPIDQIAFALKSISGFSLKEIAAALLIKEENIKKRLQRAKAMIKENDLAFCLPDTSEIKDRLQRVLNIIYLIFNEGYHSYKKDQVIRKDLCGEAMRLCSILLKKEAYRSGASYALFGLICLHSARLDSKVNAQNELINLKDQDRSQWFKPLISLGNEALLTAAAYPDKSSYHFEAAIALQHLKSPSLQATNWAEILSLYKSLYTAYPSPSVQLNMASVQLQMMAYEDCKQTLEKIKSKDLEKSEYLYHATWAEYYIYTKQNNKAYQAYDLAINLANSPSEKVYFKTKQANIQV